MFSSLGVVVLALVPVYLTYRVWQHYGYTKSLEKMLNQRTDTSH
jgi:hypothetical protein